MIPRFSPLTPSALRRELSYRSLKIARLNPHEVSYGSVPSVIFRDEDGRHGNFHTASYQSIQASADWIIRLNKVYTSSRWIPRRWDRSRAELDCANSSDALLMNIFCHPGLLERPAVSSLLGVDSGLRPEFGFKPRIPLKSGRTDQTEIDMRLGGLLIEAKLTEGNFQTCSLARIQKYQSAEEVFDVEELPRRGDRVESYQLIRGALAAWHLGQSFAVLSDARRADLVEHGSRSFVRYAHAIFVAVSH